MPPPILERRHQPLASRSRFLRRMSVCLLLALALVVFALTVGTLGYHWFADFGWVDSLLNAAMILTGMGPIGALTTTRAKLFASAYALFSGLVFLTLVITLLTPVIHRMLHAFHLDERDLKDR
jgi:hypothetical protein